MSGTRINPKAEDSGKDRVVCHGNTLSCWDEKNMACDSPPGDDDLPVSHVRVLREQHDAEVASGRIRTLVDAAPYDHSGSDAYKAGVWDFQNSSVTEPRLAYDGAYAAGVHDTRTEKRDDEDRCSNGCVCTTIERVVADNPQVSIAGDEEIDGGPYPVESIYVKFTVRRAFDTQATEPDQFLQYLIEMLELPQEIEAGKVDYWVTGADVYGIDS